MKLNKKVIIITSVAILIIIAIIFAFFMKNSNKNLNIGNNLNNKTLQEVEEYILNISSYETEVEVSIESNKNKTKYLLAQKYVSPNIEKQIVKEPSNIQGLETIYDGSKLTIHNSKLNLTTIYENYPYLTDNYVWLHSFIEDYRNAKEKLFYKTTKANIINIDDEYLTRMQASKILSRALLIILPLTTILLSLSYFSHSSSGMKPKRNLLTCGRRISRKCPPPISKGEPSTSTERQSPPATSSFSSIRKSVIPACFNLFATVNPAAPAPKIKYCNFIPPIVFEIFLAS